VKISGPRLVRNLGSTFISGHCTKPALADERLFGRPGGSGLTQRIGLG